jgi:hypothetical protein
MGGKAEELIRFGEQGIFISSQVFSLILWPTQLLNEQLQGGNYAGNKVAIA